VEGDAGTTAFTFTVSRTGDTTGSHSVDWAVTGSGSLPADADDFGGTFPSDTVTFADGETAKTITVNVAGDATPETAEGFTVTLDNATGGAQITTDTADGTILNDDVQPAELSIAADNAIQAEGNADTTAFTFTVTRSGNTSVEHTVDWEVTGSGDVNFQADAEDFGGSLPSGKVTFDVGETEKIITVNVDGDITAENDEGFTVTLDNASKGATITAPTATGTIQWDDGQGFAIQAESASKAEGDSGTTEDFTFTVTRFGDQSAFNAVNWAVAAGTGTGTDILPADASDFVGGTFPTGPPLIFGTSATQATITVNVQGDDWTEYNNDFQVSITKSGAQMITATATGMILDDDVAAGLSPPTVTTAEGFPLSGDDGPDTLTANINTSAIIGNSISVDGLGWADTIDVDLFAAQISNNPIDINGDIGNYGENEGDTITLNLTGAAIQNNPVNVDGGYGPDNINLIYNTFDGSNYALTSASAFAGNAFTLDGGAGNDTISMDLNVVGLASSSASFASAGFGATATESLNTFKILGKSGTDTLTLNLLADIDASATNVESSGSANAFFANNSISMTGGNGGIAGAVENLTLNLTATIDAIASGPGSFTASAAFYNNTIKMDGGGGTDHLLFDLDLTLKPWTTSSIANAKFTNNSFKMYGQAGNDILTMDLVDIDISASGSTTEALFSNNSLLMDGGTGNDNLIFNLGTSNDISPATPNNINTVTLIGGPGNDTISISADTTDAAFIFKYSGATELGDTIDGLGLSHELSFLFSGVFEGTFTAGTSGNELISSCLVFGTISAAADANDFWIYDGKAGALYCDADANGGGTAVTVAQFYTASGSANTDVGLVAGDLTVPLP